MKIISFSVWGQERHYYSGAIQNIKLAKTIYPDWQCWIYCDKTAPEHIIDDMEYEGAKVILMDSDRWNGLFWRFLPAGDPSVEVMIVRDTDSRVNVREKACVDEWLASDKCFHCMRDHIEHNVAIMGGMWGCKRDCIPDFTAKMNHWIGLNNLYLKGDDQVFLADIIWPLVREKALVHDCYHDGVFMFPGNQINTWKDILEYNDQPWCGEPKMSEYNEAAYMKLKQERETHPHQRGRIVLNNGFCLGLNDIYEYHPQLFFGTHDIRPFPQHAPVEFGMHVGKRVTLSEIKT